MSAPSWQTCVEFIDLLRGGDHFSATRFSSRNQLSAAARSSRRPVWPEWTALFPITPDGIKSLLNAWIKPTGKPCTDIRGELFSGWVHRLLAAILDSQPNQRSGPSGRPIRDTAGFFIVPAKVIRQVRVCRGALAALRVDQLVVNPDWEILAIETIGNPCFVECNRHHPVAFTLDSFQERATLRYFVKPLRRFITPFSLLEWLEFGFYTVLREDDRRQWRIGRVRVSPQEETTLMGPYPTVWILEGRFLH